MRTQRVEGSLQPRLSDSCIFESMVAGSSDMRALLAREDAAAREAVELFCYRIVKYVGAYLAALEGRTQAIVFTGGIGSGSAEIRRQVSESLAWTGLRLDASRNACDDERISDSTSSLVAFAFVADEESAIAAETLRWFSR